MTVGTFAARSNEFPGPYGETPIGPACRPAGYFYRLGYIVVSLPCVNTPRTRKSSIFEWDLTRDINSSFVAGYSQEYHPLGDLRR